MPNWCWNNLNVSGNEKQLQEFVEKSIVKDVKQAHEFSFEGTLPRGDRKDWYDWSVNNWGTKWDACESYINNNDIDYFSVSFDTAWAPPVDWLKNIAIDYPDLEFELEYEEPGMCFGGTFTIQGDDEQDAQWDLDAASECCQGPINWEHEELEQQCLICGEETETRSINVADIKPAKIKINESNEN